MITLYAAPRTRAVRIVWLLEEMGQPYALERVTFKATTDRFFIQDTPTGKIPTLTDGDVVMSESGAIVEFLLERYGAAGNVDLAPAAGTAARARYLQWLHYAESTAFAPLGVVIWLTRYRQDAAEHPVLVEDAQARARRAFEHLAEAFGSGPYLVGEQFTAADIMMGFTLFAAATLNALEDQPLLEEYLSRITARPAFARTLELLPL